MTKIAITRDDAKRFAAQAKRFAAVDSAAKDPANITESKKRLKDFVAAYVRNKEFEREYKKLANETLSEAVNAGFSDTTIRALAQVEMANINEDEADLFAEAARDFADKKEG